jgi:signal transduction histidine kinase
MKTPAFVRTIGFRLTIWYTVLLVLFGVFLIVGINLAMQQARRDIPLHFMGGNQQPAEVAVIVGDRYLDYLRLYSLISLGGLVVLGGIGGYFLSRKMLKPVDNVTTLASSISTNNLKERIHYQGPDDEMKRLADTFDSMLGRLEDAFESQNQFIQDASHELRTPIATAQTNIEVVEMERKPSIKDYKRLVEVLKLSIERMSKLSDKLLLLSKDNQQSAERSVVNIATLIGEVVTEFYTYSLNSKVNLQLNSIPDYLSVKGDALSLKQAISNVIDNAIRYNRPGGQVNISTQIENGQLNIQVQDSGIGISKADQKHIFDRFYRVDKSRSRAQGGSGLGLAIVKEIIEDHGGTVTVDSTLDKGSTFRMTLPLHSSN